MQWFMMTLNLKKTDKEYYAAGMLPRLASLSRCLYLSVDYAGALFTASCNRRMQMLYDLVSELRNLYRLKKVNFYIPPFEGRYADGGFDISTQHFTHPSSWKLMIRLPSFIQKEAMDAARCRLVIKRKDEWIFRAEMATLGEGPAVQILHVGRHHQQHTAIMLIRAFLEQRQLLCRGEIHEIYLSPHSKMAGSELKMIIRIPVKKENEDT